MRWGCAVILRDCATTGDAAVIVHIEQAGLENVTAGIVEIDIDPVRTRLAQCSANAAGLIVHRRVEAELIDQPGALLGTSGHAHHLASKYLGDLANQGSN